MHKVNRRRYILGLLAFGLAWLLVAVALLPSATNAGEQLAVPALACLAVLYFLTELNVRVETADRSVHFEWLLFDRIPVWERQRSFSDFTAVEVWRRTGSTDKSDGVYVYFLSAAGKHIKIYHFWVEPGKPCVEAEAIGQKLAETMSLEYHNYAV